MPNRAVVGHPARETWPQLISKWRRLNAETYGLFKDRTGGRMLWLARNWLMPLSVIAHTPTVFSTSALTGVDERTRAWITLARVRLWRFVDAHRLVFSGGA